MIIHIVTLLVCLRFPAQKLLSVQGSVANLNLWQISRKCEQATSKLIFVNEDTF